MDLKIIFNGLGDIQIEMDEELRKYLDAYGAEKMIEEGAKKAVEVCKEEIAENFYEGGRPTWPAKADGSPATNIDTGALFKSTQNPDVSITEEEIIITTKGCPYAGEVDKKRPFMDIPEEGIEKVAQAFLEGAFPKED